MPRAVVLDIDGHLVGGRLGPPSDTPGPAAALRAIACRWPIVLVSSADPAIVSAAVERAGLSDALAATVTAGDLGIRAALADAHLEAARRLDLTPDQCLAVEDSADGIRSALAAGMPLIALGDPGRPLPAELPALAVTTVPSLADLTVDLIVDLDLDLDLDRDPPVRSADARLDEQEAESFPASDPHADWAGPS